MPVSTLTGGRRLRECLAEPLVVGEPDGAGPLAVFPVFGGTCKQPFVAFSQADGKVVIGEAESASVRDLAVVNHGDVPVLLYEGEEVLGGQQNRSIDMTVLVAPNGKLSMPVSCVESGRWDHRSHRAAFRSSGQSPSPSMRRSKSDRVHASLAARGRGYADQGEVWGLVDSISARLGTRSDSRAFSDAYEQRRADLNAMARDIALHEGQIGTLAAIGHDLCVLDLVARPEVFAALHGPLVQGYALEALAAGSARTKAPKVETGQELVDAALDAAADQQPSLGLGADARFATDQVSGSALVNDGELVQLTAFPGGRRFDAGTLDGRSAPIRRPSQRRPNLA